jgi:hypothetical protein
LLKHVSNTRLQWKTAYAVCNRSCARNTLLSFWQWLNIILQKVL